MDEPQQARNRAKRPTSAWAEGVARSIGERVAYYRGQRKLSARQLADLCGELGFPSVTQVVITKLENGRREAVSVAEIQVLGAALGVPPVLLLFPLGFAHAVEVLPDVHVPPLEAVRWFGGLQDLDHPLAPAQLAGQNAVALFEDHQGYTQMLPHLMASVQAAADRLQLEGETQQYEREGANERAAIDHLTMHVKGLRRLRATMRQMGMIPPPISGITAGMLGEKDYEPLEDEELGEEAGERFIGLAQARINRSGGEDEAHGAR